jgi:two-component system OmpR family response regulator
LAILVCEAIDPNESSVVRALVGGGFTVAARADAGEPGLVDARTFEAVVISMEGPPRTGVAALKLCSELRASGYHGAIILAGTRRRSEGVDALARGADDFVARPIDASEIVARLRAVLRRIARASRLRWGEVEVDVTHRTTYLRGAHLSLTSREQAVLACLVEAAGAMVSRKQLLRRVWKRDDDPGTNFIEVHVSRLREKLGADSALIETVRRAGYRLRKAPTSTRT